MTVHAAKGLEFPVVFVVNLGKGASGPPQSDQGLGSGWSAPFRRALRLRHGRGGARPRDERKPSGSCTSRCTRARDRLYLSTVLKDGQFTAGPGSLGAVLPESLKAVFAQAASVTAGDITWPASSGRIYTFRRCVVQEHSVCTSGSTAPALD